MVYVVEFSFDDHPVIAPAPSLDIATSHRHEMGAGRALNKYLNFNRLSRVVEDTSVVRLNLLKGSDSFKIQEAGGATHSLTLDKIMKNGITIPTQDLDKSGLVFSVEPGVTQVNVLANLDVSSLAAVIAAEFGAHVVPGLEGEGVAIADDAVHLAREFIFKEAARSNASQY